jgi:hypothetical protein
MENSNKPGCSVILIFVLTGTVVTCYVLSGFLKVVGDDALIFIIAILAFWVYAYTIVVSKFEDWFSPTNPKVHIMETKNDLLNKVGSATPLETPSKRDPDKVVIVKKDPVVNKKEQIDDDYYDLPF